MLVKNNKLFPYPLLSSNNDDYVNSVFYVKISEANQTKKNLILSLSVELKNNEIERLILNEKAEIICHFESSKTKYREIKELNIGDNNIYFDILNLNGTLDITPLIILKDDVKDFNSKDFNKDYGDRSFSIESGSILALGEQARINIEKDISDLSKVPSIISIVKNSGTEKNMIVDFDDNKIRIKLNSEDFKIYNSIAKSTTCQSILNSMIIIPSLMSVLEQLKSFNNDEMSRVKEYRWYKVVSNVIKKKYNSELEPKFLENKNIFEISQELFESPISDGMSNLFDLVGGRD